MQQLKWLVLKTSTDENRIVESMFSLPLLESLHYTGQNTDSLPDRFSALPKLISLKLKDLSTGPLQSSIFELDQLAYLDVETYGAFDPRLLELKQLRWFGAGFSHGTLSDEFLNQIVSGNVFPALEGLRIAHPFMLDLFRRYPHWNKLTTLVLNRLEQVDLDTLDVDLSQLKRLKINSTTMSALPDWVCRCKNLVSVDLHGNLLEQAPTELLSLPLLKQVNLNDNPISEEDFSEFFRAFAGK